MKANFYSFYHLHMHTSVKNKNLQSIDFQLHSSIINHTFSNFCKAIFLINIVSSKYHCNP